MEIVERTFCNLKRTCLGMTYQHYDDILEGLIYKMRDRIGHPFIGEEFHNLRFAMNIPLYREFCIVCQMSGHDSNMYKGIKILLDPTLYIGNTQSPDGIVRLVYEEPEVKRHIYYSDILKGNHDFWTTRSKIKNKPHIDHVKFNGPATIVFWKDGTKTVVKHDGKGRKDKRQAILYAFIRKIYGEGKPYNNILNEIEEAIK